MWAGLFAFMVFIAAQRIIIKTLITAMLS